MSSSPGFYGELGNYCICLCVAQSYITGSLESSHVMVVSYGTEAAFNQAILCALGKVGQGLIPAASTGIHWQQFVFVPATRNTVPGNLEDLPAHLEW